MDNASTWIEIKLKLDGRCCISKLRSLFAISLLRIVDICDIKQSIKFL